MYGWPDTNTCDELFKKKYEVDFVDMITEPGPVKILSASDDSILFQAIKNRIDISVNKHYSQILTLFGHYDCAGNPVDETEQKKQIVKSVNKLKKTYMNYELKIIVFWIDENFKIKKIYE